VCTGPPPGRSGDVKEIVVGVDGSDMSTLVLRWALDDARCRGIAVRALLVWHADRGHTSDDNLAGAPPGGSREAGASFLHDQIERLGARAEGVEIIEDIADGDPAEVLIERSRGEMLVVGARERGRLRRLVLGSVSQACLHHAEIPVVIIRNSPPHAVLERPVLVGVDGSEPSVAAVRFAADEAAARRVRLRVLHAWTITPAPYPPGAAASYQAAPGDNPERASQRIIDDCLRRGLAGGPAVEVDREIVPGPAASTLLTAAADAQLLVVGSHGRGGFSDALLRSTSHRCALRSPCPAAIVCPPG
jgi:nucleotide-binding universal stress UspA family protein